MDIEGQRRTDHRGPASRIIHIELLALDLTACTRCLGTDRNLETAIEIVRRVLETIGAEVRVRKTLVESVEQAGALHLVSSPTIRVNGRDIAIADKESRCGSCESLVGGERVDCRVWVYQGQEFTEAPVGMIVDAILREIYAGEPRQDQALERLDNVPDNLKRFFSGKAGSHRRNQGECCSTGVRTGCCDSSEEAACCGTSATSTCGCV